MLPLYKTLKNISEVIINNFLLILKYFNNIKGTLIGIKFTGVKNPPSTGLTVDFEIESKNIEKYTIDKKIDIPGVNIILPLSVG